jgi:hypothetical protein
MELRGILVNKERLKEMENVLEVNKIRRKILFFSYRLDDELWSG